MKLWESMLNFISGRRNSKIPIQNEILSQLGSQSPVVVYRMRRYPRLEFEFIGDAITELVGYTPEEHYQNPMLGNDLVHPEDQAKMKLFTNYPNNTKAVLRIRFVHKSGHIVNTEHHIYFEEDKISGIILDVTEISESEKRLRESEDRLVVALESTGVAIWEWDLESSIVNWKNSVEDVLGVEKGSINESIDSYFSLIYEEDRAEFLETISNALQNADNYNAEHRILDKNGNFRWIEAYAQIFRDSNGKTIRWVGTLRNITELRLQEFENRELYNRSRNQSRALVELAMNETFFSGELDSSLKLILRVGAQVLGVAKTSIWMFREDYSTLECLYSYSAVDDNFSFSEHFLVSSEVPNYFKYILGGRVLVSNDTFNDSRAVEFLDSYSKKVNVHALMDASVRVRGKIVGIFSVENVGDKRQWKSDEVMFAGLLADQAAIAIVNAERKQSEEQIKLLNKNLERLIEERTQQLRMTNKDLSQTLENLSKTQSQLILSEKMASLGQLIAGIAHEINNPIGTIKASLELIRSFRGGNYIEKSNLPSSLMGIESDLIELSNDFFNYSLTIKDIPTGMLRRKNRMELETYLGERGIRSANTLSDRLVDIGIVTIPDEYTKLLENEKSEELLIYLSTKIFEEKNFESIESSINRVANLIRSLKNFTHLNKLENKTVYRVEDSIETVVTLLHNKLKHGIELVKNFNPIPSIACYPDDLIQLWTNLILNAVQAMNFNGVLEISLFQNAIRDSVVVEIIDSGPGISPENMEKIFEPFFTTKALGEGSGLGLDICKKIVHNHNGRIQCESSPGRTKFRVTLPIA